MTIRDFTVRVAKLNLDVPVSFESLPESSQQFGAEYGFRQWLNDKTAPFKRESFPNESDFRAACRTAVDNAIAQMNDGTCGTRTSQAAVVKAQAAEIAKLKAELAAATRAASKRAA